MKTIIFDANNTMLGHLRTGLFSYEPKDIHVEAVQVTRDNVGKLALEFETELEWDGMEGSYFTITVARGDGPDEMFTKRLTVRLGDWIIPLRGEIHVYKDYMFRNTFDPEGGVWPMSEEPLVSATPIREESAFPTPERKFGIGVTVRWEGKNVGVVNDYRARYGAWKYLVKFDDDLEPVWVEEETLEPFRVIHSTPVENPEAMKLFMYGPDENGLPHTGVEPRNKLRETAGITEYPPGVEEQQKN